MPFHFTFFSRLRFLFVLILSFLCQCHIFYDWKIFTDVFIHANAMLAFCAVAIHMHCIGRSNNNNIMIRQINIWWFFNLTLFILWIALEALLMHSWMRHSLDSFYVWRYIFLMWKYFANKKRNENAREQRRVKQFLNFCTSTKFCMLFWR